MLEYTHKNLMIPANKEVTSEFLVSFCVTVMLM